MLVKFPRTKIILYAFLILSYFIIYCIKKGDSYKYENFVTISKLYDIPLDGNSEYHISEVRHMDVANNGNLYVLSSRDGTITVFNNNGVYLKTIGSKGQGPNELERPMSFYIYDETDAWCYFWY